MVPHMIEDAFLPGDVPTGRPGGERPTLPPSERGLSLDEDKLKPIAIVGFCFRFPEDAVSPRGFWDMMMEKRCAMTESPKDRISVPGWHHPDSRRRGQYPSRGAHYLKEDVSLFDAPFFSLSADEAAALDPQQRHLLEVTYRALENAGIPMEKAVGSQTSVHVGCMNSDYRLMTCKDVASSADYDVVGINQCMNANRISWFFDFHGTSMNIDTACSSSLVALDLACQCLQNGETEMGIVSGTNLLLSPDMMQVFSNVNMLSPDSKCYSFDHRANGYGRGEGTATLVIKRLETAIKDGDTIRAVIRATGSNSDGLTPSGIMQPNGSAQAKLIRDTYQKAGLSMVPTRFFEAHGTGTPVGDPIECNALGEAFRAFRTTNDPLIVGSVKSNIGHLEGASGVAALIKTILVLENGIIPPNANFEKLNPKIDLEYLRLKLPLEATPWPTLGLRRASVNSFGFGGSNAHVVLDDACHYLQEHGLDGNHVTTDLPPALVAADEPHRVLSTSKPVVLEPTLESPKLLMVSSSSQTGLKQVALGYKSYFEGLTLAVDRFQEYADDLAHTLNTRRSALAYKSFWVASTPADLCNVDTGTSHIYTSLEKPVLGFVFTGQGSQWAGMGRELFQYPVFRNTMDECEADLRGFGCLWSLRAEILDDSPSSRINAPEIAQPANTALQIALVELLGVIGVKPAAVIGHSSGEIAAAYALGALSRNDAMRTAYFRGVCAAQLASTTTRPGAMVAVGLSEADTRVYLEKVHRIHNHPGINVACINSQKSVTVSGDADQVETLKHLLDTDGVFARKLKISVAYHSSHMEQVADTYAESMAGLCTRSTPENRSRVMISSVTGDRALFQELQNPDYWVANLVSPVRFMDALLGICTESGRRNGKKLDGSHRTQLGVNMILEVGPHATLQGPIRDILDTLAWGRDVRYSPVIRRKENAAYGFLHALGHIHCLGNTIDLVAVNRLTGSMRKHPRVLTDLPEYPFDHSTSYWREGRLSKRSRLATRGRHDLLGKPVDDWNVLEARWRHHIRLTELPWVEDHIINGALIYPAAGMLVMAVEAADQLSDPQRRVYGYLLRDIEFQRALTVPRTAEGIETSLLLRTKSDGSNVSSPWLEFRLFSYDNDEWRENCHGEIKVDYGSADELAEQSHELEDWLQQEASVTGACIKEFDHTRLYKRLRNSGYEFGPTFQTVLSGKCNEEHKATGSVKVFHWPASQHPQAHVIHPTTLDGILHLSLAAIAESEEGDISVPTAIPTGIQSLWIAKEGLNESSAATIHASARKTKMNSRGHEFDIGATDEQGTRVLVRMNALRSTIVTGTAKDTTELAKAKATTAYHLSRVPDLALLSREQVMAYCAPAFPNKPDPIGFFKELNFVLYKFLDDAVQALDRLPEDEIDVLPHIRRYTEWARLQRTKYIAGELPLSQDGWATYLQDLQHFEAACQRIASTNDLGYAYVRTGRNLPSILRGELNPLEFLFTGDMMARWYSEVNNRAGCFNRWALYLRTLARKNPAMRILEIGAGTGGSTGHILNALSVDDDDNNPLYLSYDYTDISSAFFERAAERYTRFPRLNFRTLDITNDPEMQGFQLEAYDLVVAANVLHATPDIQATMHHVRKLLRPDGKIMLYEITRPDIIRSGFIAGLMEGWWAGIEDKRPWSPALTVSQWDSVFKASGFTGVDIEFPEFLDSECQEMAILVASALENTPESAAQSPTTPSFYLVLDTSSERQQTLRDRVDRSLQHRYPRSEIQSGSLEDCASRSVLTETTVVFLQETERPLLSEMTSRTFAHIQQVINHCNSILWVTAGGGHRPMKPEYAIVDGWARTLRNEKASRRFCTLALDIDHEIQSYQAESIVRVIDKAVLERSGVHEHEFVEVDGMLQIPRVEPTKWLTDEIHATSLPQTSSIQPLSEAGPVKLACATPGLLSSLHWVDDHDANQPLQSDEVEIDTQAVGVNFRDVQIALGQDLEASFGHECAGVVAQAGELSGFYPGDRVLVFGPGRFKTRVRARKHFVHRIQDSLPLDHAAGVPATFGVMWHILAEIGRLRSNQSILIHSATGGMGQAAIQIAQYIGAEVYTTVSTREKKQCLVEEYGIAPDHIFYSRDPSFARSVMKATNTRGVDVAICYSGGEIQQASWECLSPYGSLIQVGNSADAVALRARPGRQASFVQFDSLRWMSDRPHDARESIDTVLSLMAEYRLRMQTPCSAKDASSIEQTFRTMQDGASMGKTVIDLTANVEVPTMLDTKAPFKLDSDATYVIAGGLGGLGRTIARWMVGRGARNLVLLGRSGVKTGTAASKLVKELSNQGVYIHTPPCDVMDAASVQQVLQQVSQRMPPIKGCVQGSMVLRDQMFSEMSYEDWRVSVECKALGSWNLETNLPRDLDFFVMLSSASNVIGLTGQSNYAAGNSYMDSLARFRVGGGQKAISLDLGPMVDDGILVETDGFLDKVLGYGSLAPVTRAQLHAILDHYCNPNRPVLTLDTAQLVFGISGESGDGHLQNTLTQNPLFYRLQLESIPENSWSQDHDQVDFKKLFQATTSLHEAREIVRRAIIDKMVHSYRLIAEEVEVDVYAPLHTYRVDSLLAVELCNWIGKEFVAEVAVLEVMGGATLAMVDLLVATRSQLQHPAWDD